MKDAKYSHERFLEDYGKYKRETGWEIQYLDLDANKNFVSYCRECGKGANRCNIFYSVFVKKQKPIPLCYKCQQKKNQSKTSPKVALVGKIAQKLEQKYGKVNHLSDKEKLEILTLIDKEFPVSLHMKTAIERSKAKAYRRVVKLLQN